MSWPLQYRKDAPADFEASPEIQQALAHGIGGLNPHAPLFPPDRCTPWTLAPCVRTSTRRNETRYSVRLPFRQRNLRAFLWYHKTGDLLHIRTASHAPCPTHPTQKYGACCFPKIIMQCHRITGYKDRGLCMNPLHFRVGSENDERREEDDEGLLLPWNNTPVPEELPPPCPQCSWVAGI